MITEWFFNNKMRELVDIPHWNLCAEKVTLDVRQLEKLFCPSFKQVKDCVLISEKSILQLEANFDKAMQIHMDKTGYEASSTETRINCFFDNEISLTTSIKIALMVLEVWARQLKELEPTSQFCLILFADNGYAEIRFHKIHENESRWLMEDLEVYNEPVGYSLI